ncbi:MAG: hydrogenase maturation protease [Nitriliruptoraceae bacterium]
MTVLVLGVGHPDRGDDAAGTLVARALDDTPGIVARTVSGDPSQLLTDPLWDTAARVVLVDTVRTGQPPGTVQQWSGQRLLEHLPATGGGTHDLGVATTLHLAAALQRLPATLTVIGIEGIRFEVGHPPCRPVRHAAAAVAAALVGSLDGTAASAATEVAVRAVDLAGGVRGPQRRHVGLRQG